MRLFNPFSFSALKSAGSVAEQSHLFRIPPLNIEPNYRIINPTEEALKMLRRRVREDGSEIIDKPTYHKLTNDFVRNKGVIIRGEDAKKHLESNDAYASYLPSLNSAFIRDDATVSDVLEEMYHAKQDRAKMFSNEKNANITRLKREVDAQKYLLSMTNKYKIPKNEVELTKKNLEKYENELKAALEDE